MQNGVYQRWIIIIDAFMCERHFNIELCECIGLILTSFMYSNLSFHYLFVDYQTLYISNQNVKSILVE